ncbi:MAG: NAD(P)(+) transhydrogenase (Re/Si-specific) subunit alpha [Acidobacteria bacterium]|nr:MAG: NAD(P)(+) transhydrogenase (Re/Si-specific) subunit alpha [Acidobacteriota bacterium]
MLIAILKEARGDETRVALTPDAVKSLAGKGFSVAVESNAGLQSGASDGDYQAAGATISQNRAELLACADVVPVVNLPPAEEQEKMKSGSVVIGFLRPLDDPAALTPAVKRGVTLFSMELVPRITRAQSMDALSSMATVAGYKAVIAAADHLPKLFPLLMTAAGTIPPAKVLVLGAGVAGLQAIATARRLGAVVEAYDVRAAAGEQVKSLGAKFIEVDLGGLQTEDKGGYAKELSPEALELGRQAIATAAKNVDLVITTAQVPGRRAPLMLPTAAVEGMRPGSIIFDLAAPAGGNCELTKCGETVIHHGVTIFGPANLPAEVPAHASMLYSRNLSNFMQLILKKGELSIDRADEIIAGSCVATGGEFVNEKVSAALAALKVHA